MAEKLTDVSWNAFTKSELTAEQRKLLDTAPMVKALAALDKVGEDKPDQRLEALDDVVEQIKKQVTALAKVKKALGDKPFGEIKDKLYGLLDEAERQHKTMQAKAAAEKAKAAKSDKGGKGGDDDEDESTPALLSTKMLPLLKELRKGEARMNALVCTAGARTAVLIMRRAISPSRRPLLAEAVDAKGGMKYIPGECVFEKDTKTLVFELKAPAAGLAKRLREALLNQVAMRLKVKVRGEGGDDVHGEDEGDEPEAAGAAQAAAPTAPPGGPASAEALSYTQRLNKVRDTYEQALRDRHPEATQLRALMGVASEKAGAKDYAAAIKSLQMVERVLAGATGDAADAAAALKARLTALVPRVKEAVAAAAPSAVDIKLKVSEAGVYATKKDYARAHALLDEAEDLLSQSGGVPPDWGRRFADVEARYLATLKTQPANASTLRAAMEAVNAAAEQDDYKAAAAALARVESLIDEAGSLGRETDVIPEGLVAARIAAFEQARKRWEAGVAEARASMKPIQAGLTGEYAAAVPAIDNILNSYRQDLAGLLADAKAAQDAPAVVSATRQLRAKVGELRAEIRSESLFVYLDGAGAPITPTFESALDDIDALIAA